MEDLAVIIINLKAFFATDPHGPRFRCVSGAGADWTIQFLPGPNKDGARQNKPSPIGERG